MSEMVVRFKWDGDDLGPVWMNPDNLELLLYSERQTRRELLQFEMVEDASDGLYRGAHGKADVWSPCSGCQMPELHGHAPGCQALEGINDPALRSGDDPEA